MFKHRTFIFFLASLLAAFIVSPAIADEQVVSSDDASSEVNLGNNLRSDVALKMQQGSTADELLKWKNLLDKGAITQEEYDKAKRDLLG